MSELELLDQMRASGKPQYVMRGDGKPLGYFAILSASTRSSFLDRNGVGKQIDVSVKLRRAQAPAPQSYFSLFAGWF